MENLKNQKIYGSLLYSLLTTQLDQLIYQWDLKINFLTYEYDNCPDDEDGVTCIGISNAITPNKYFADDYDNFYLYDHVYESDGTKYDNSAGLPNCWWFYGINEYGYKVNDIVSIHLDLHEKTVSFSINNQDQGIAYKNIKKGKDLKYKFVASVLTGGTHVQLIDFKATHKKC